MTDSKNLSAEEQAYLVSYDITQFDRPSVAADIAVFSIMKTYVLDGNKNYRKDPERKLKLLLIRRALFHIKTIGHCLEDFAVRERAWRIRQAGNFGKRQE